MLNLFFSKRTTGILTSFLLAAAVALLAGCGSGGAGTTGTTTTAAVGQVITGTVATGAPLAGATITIKDSLGKTVTGISNSAGVFGIAVTGMTPPFMLAAVATGQSNMYSILPAMDMAATNTQNVNITPVTTLVMYELSGADPASMFNNGTFSTITAANVSAKETIVRSRLPANAVNPIFSMMYGNFVASVHSAGTNPDPYDAALDGIGKITAITPASVTFSIAPAYTPGSSAAAALSIALTLTDNTAPFAARTSLASSSPARVTAIVTNANGTPVANAIVSFTTSDPRDTFSGGANTALTNSSGAATVTLTTSNTSGGASTVTASTTVSGATATNYLNYGIGSSTITLSALTFPATTLSAYGTASVSVNVLNNGVPYTTPLTVSFTSSCAATGKATLTASVTTLNGTATANYLDNGCNNSTPGDTITATLTNGVTSTGNLPVGSPALGSIQFVSVVTNPVTTPTMITLKGTGGTGRSETARVTFRVVDSAGNPLGNALVDFSLNTALGGLSLSSASATSDSVTGNVVTNVISGTFSTAVRVTARTGNLSSQSDQLLISTGIPSQDGISLSASTHNIEGWAIDGVTTTLTARLADHFHNPVPDGTAVYFTAEGGSIVPSCITVGGVCTTVLTSQELRPNSVINGYGRVEVLARAIGEEAFVDLNGNGTADWGEMIDDNNLSTDMGEAYVDYNEDNCRASYTEPYIDFNNNGAYNGRYCGISPAAATGGDGLYNGVLCTAGSTICSTQKSIDVRSSQVIIFSDSWAASPASLAGIVPASVPITTPALPGGCCNAGIPVTGIVLSSCTTVPAATVSLPSSVTVTVVDTHGNAMPAGTVVSFTTSNGATASPASWTVPDTIGCRTGFPGCPPLIATPTFGDITVSLASDAVYAVGPPATCTNARSGGVFTVTVTSPGFPPKAGGVTIYTMDITD